MNPRTLHFKQLEMRNCRQSLANLQLSVQFVGIELCKDKDWYLKWERLTNTALQNIWDIQAELQQEFKLMDKGTRKWWQFWKP